MAEVIPTNWELTPHEIRVTVTPVDEFGIPYDRRAVKTGIPRPSELDSFAADLGESVRRTVVHILTGKIEEEENNQQ